MKFDVATFTSFWLMTFLCCALVTTALSRMFAQVTAFRFWAIGFYLLAASAACFALNLSWPNPLLLVGTATLALQSRILIWVGTRELFGLDAPWGRGLAVTVGFFLLYSGALALNEPLIVRALLFVAFFLPFRVATLVEVFRRRRPQMGAGRTMVLVGSAIATLNTFVPLVLVLLNHDNTTLLIGDPRKSSLLFAVLFAGDLILASGLIVLAARLMLVERDMLATLERGTIARRAESRRLRALRDLHLHAGTAAFAADEPTPQRESLQRTV